MKALVIKSLRKFHLYGPAKLVQRALAPMHPHAIREKNRMVHFYSRFVGPGDLCFDIGANVGSRTGIFLKLGASVVTVEPQESCMRQLRKQFGRKNNVTLVHKAVGERTGHASMHTCEQSPLTSLSEAWIEKVNASGRHTGYTWHEPVTVPVTTLDALIDEFGTPAFVKVDVEGYEYPVLKGLSVPVRALSFEFTPECLGGAIDCINHLAGMGTFDFNFSVCDTLRWELSKWVPANEMCEVLRNFRPPAPVGDVYARLAQA